MDDTKERERCERLCVELDWSEDESVVRNLLRERADAFEAGRKAGREENSDELEAMKELLKLQRHYTSGSDGYYRSYDFADDVLRVLGKL